MKDYVLRKCIIQRETNKAYLVSFRAKKLRTGRSFWIPKSQIEIVWEGEQRYEDVILFETTTFKIPKWLYEKLHANQQPSLKED